MKTLRGLMDSKSERTRLAAVLRASEILLEHQRGEERAAIAIERAAARKAEAGVGGGTNAGASTQAPQTQQTAEEAARAFLASIAREEESNATAA